MSHFAQEQAPAAGSTRVNQAAAAARFRALHAGRPLAETNNFFADDGASV